MLDSLGADQSVSDFLYHAGFASDHENFQAIVVVQVNVQRGQDVVEMGVLKPGEFLVQEPNVVVVYQRDGTDHVGLRALPSGLNQLVTDQIPKSFGAVGVSAGRDQLVELL